MTGNDSSLPETASEVIGYFQNKLYMFEKGFLARDSIFAFADNRSYLDMTIDELWAAKDSLKLRYIQMDSKHKCIPPDWYIGYETFTTYSFY